MGHALGKTRPSRCVSLDGKRQEQGGASARGGAKPRRASAEPRLLAVATPGRAHTARARARAAGGAAGPHLSQRLQPTQSSVRGAEAIWPARQPSQGTISSTSVGQARTHCVQPMQVS